MQVPRLNKIIAFILIFCSVAVQANTIDFTQISSEKEWKAIFQKAKEENKLVFVDVYTDWCGYCKKLDKEVYTDERVVAFFNENFINVKFNAETPFGYPRAAAFNVEGYPTMLFLTDEQQVFERIGGFVPVDALMAYGQDVSESWLRLPFLAQRYISGEMTSDEQLEYIGILARGDNEKAHEVAKGYIAKLTPASYEEIETLWLVSQYGNYIDDAPYKHILANKEQIIEWHGDSEYEDFLKAAYNDNLMLAIRYGDKELLNRIVTETLPEFVEEVTLPEAAHVTKKVFAGQREEWTDYQLEINSYLNNHVLRSEREQFLFSNALEIVDSYSSDEMIGFAAELLDQLLEMNENHFEGLTLSAYTDGLKGDFEACDKKLEKAEELATNSDKKEMLEGLKEAISVLKDS